MSERLTDEALAELEDIALLRLSKEDREAGNRLDGREAIEVRNKAASRYLINLVLEVKDRRSSDLTAEELEALRWLVSWVTPQLDVSGDPDSDCPHCVNARRALAVLDKLTRRP